MLSHFFTIHEIHGAKSFPVGNLQERRWPIDPTQEE
jgi:hypothetical protein